MLSFQCPKNHNTLAEPLHRIQSGSKPAPGKRESPSVEQVNGKRKAHQKRRELCHGYIPTELSLQLRKQTFPSPPKSFSVALGNPSFPPSPPPDNH